MSTSNCHHRTTCRLCEAPNPELAVPLKPSPVADHYVTREQLEPPQALYPLDLYLCRACGHVQLLDVVNPDILFSHYIYTTSISLGLVEHFRRYAEAVAQRFAFPPQALAVDIGSNDGTLLKFFQERQYRVLGVDPARNIAAQATASGIPTLAEYFTAGLGQRIRREHGPVSVVTANNVFAHSDALPDMAEGIREMMADDGVFVFEVSYLVDIIDKLLFDTVFHEHLCFHSIRPFTVFFQRHGLELFDVERLPTKGGSIRGFVQRKRGPRPIQPIVGELLALEDRLGLDRPELYRAFTAKLAAIKSDLHTLLGELKNRKPTIAGFGASATVTTLLHHFELGQFLDFLVDDNASRHGLFSPGLHLPVLPPQALFERKASHCVILAWQYAEPIMKKHAAFRAAGGRFVLPMPVVKEI